MAPQTHYETLGVRPAATPQEIKQAYLELARRHHPDRSPGDEKSAGVFRRATKAYEVLSRADSRYAYDMELGIEPGGPSDVPTHHRITRTPVTGTAAGDYVESLVGGLRIPVLKRVRGREYQFDGLDDPNVRRAYEQGMLGIGRLQKSGAHQLYEQGMASLRDSDYDRAVACFVEAAKINPGNIQYRFGLGCALEANGMLGEAACEYEKILKLAQRDGYPCQPVREALISVYLRSGKDRLVKKHCKLLWEMGLRSAVAEDALRRVHPSTERPGGRSTEQPGGRSTGEEEGDS